MDITVGVINWRRPENVVKIVAALQAQDAPCRPLVVTNPSSYPLPPVDCPTVSVADLGPYSRYLPEYCGDYVLLLDDDLWPPANLVRSFVAAAQEHPDDILSLYGRRLHRGRYNYTGIGRTTEFQQVDMPVMLYWMPVSTIAEVRAGYAKWIAKGHPPVLLDDDILLPWATQRKCFVIPKGVDCLPLPQPHACAKRTPNRLQHRTKAWQECREIFDKKPP